jgi:hypothetical protein
MKVEERSVLLNMDEWEQVTNALRFSAKFADIKRDKKLSHKIELLLEGWKERRCGCLVDSDDSRITCPKHTSPQMKRALKRSTRVR